MEFAAHDVIEERPMPARSASNSTPTASEREAQDRFVRENLRRVFSIVYRIVGNVADAQDLTQETFIKALQRKDQLKDAQKGAQWLGRVASNTAIDFLRRKGRVNFTELDSLETPLPDPVNRRADVEMLRSEEAEHLDYCLESLSVRERTALVLRDVEDMPANEVARILGCSPATVRSHIANARTKFRAVFLKRKGEQ
ncbi:RNA polymerase sigma factor [Bryobacter aggregatus]|uniref:RNA polymerase sigma factor n=1 Tax=Bryobacter aggregatus TaxID=360054 RepID=UPI00055ED907|nr:sigma-70 family RNA polymerase sigma factor [Bryobacter aggregatus]